MDEKKTHHLNKIYGAIFCNSAKKPQTLNELTGSIYGNKIKVIGTRIICSICGNTKFYPNKKYRKISRYSKCKKCGKINWKNLRNKRQEDAEGEIIKDKIKDKSNKTNLKERYLKVLKSEGLVIENNELLDLNYKAILSLAWKLFVSESLITKEGEDKTNAAKELTEGYTQRLQKGKNYHKTLKRFIQNLANKTMPVGYLESGFDSFLKDFLIRGLALVPKEQFSTYIQKYSKTDALTKEYEKILQEFYAFCQFELQGLNRTIKDVLNGPTQNRTADRSAFRTFDI